MFQIFVATASWTALIRIASTFGAEVLAGYTIAIRIVIFSILPSWGLCNAAATLVGQNLGSLSLGFLPFAEPILGIFTHEPNVVAIGAECLRFVSGAYVFPAYGMMMEQAFNGAGDTYTPTLINLACYWLLQIPLAWTLAIGLGFGPRGVFSAVTAAETAVAIVAVLVFRRGTWKLQKI
jgi:Na+-driven multidrug efflux pump